MYFSKRFAHSEPHYPNRVSKKEQLATWQRGIFFAMNNDIKIRIVEIDMENGLMVTFSDITIGGYVVEELLLLEPIRERVEEPLDSN